MNFKTFLRSWWSWGLFAAIIIGIGFVRAWDKFSVALLAVLGVTGVMRALLGAFRTVAIKRIANDLNQLSANQREKELEKVAPEYRDEVKKELEDLRGFKRR
jgi:hypothetical protein